MLPRTLFTLLTLVPVVCAAGPTALDRYIAKPDPAYGFKLVGSIPCGGCTAQVLDLKSQNWRKPGEVNRTLWQHWLTVIRPLKVTSDVALLFISGGSNGPKPPAQADAMLANFAKESGAVIAELRNVPNEPLQFANEPKTRTEDSIIAYTWDKFLRGGDEEWPLRLPMTKAAVRAMDAVTAFARTPEGGAVGISRFVVAGGSKRGWTTWTTAAVDRRVIAIAPMVIDMLNLEKSFIHHWRVYGFWAPAVHDYAEMKIMDWVGTRENRALLRIEEPFSYRDRLTIPKFLVNSTGDQFFVPDSSQFYFKDLKGEKYLRYVPNGDHSLRNTDAPASLLGWFQTILAGRPRPRFSWKFDADGTIRVRTTDAPADVKLWQATNETARDFRLEKIGPAYRATPLSRTNKGYVARVPAPAKGWTAFFVELTYPGPRKQPLKFTTDVRVVPDRYPFPPPSLKPPRF